MRWDEQALKKSPNVRVQAILEPIRADGSADGAHPAVAPVTIDLRPSKPLTFEGAGDRAEVRDYRVRLQVDDADVKTEGIQAELVVLPPTTGELADVSANRGAIGADRECTPAAGCSFRIRWVSPPNLFRDVNQTLHQGGRRAALEPLVWVLFLFCGIVMTEWVLRKINGTAFNPGPGAPWWGMQGGHTPCPPEAVSSRTIAHGTYPNADDVSHALTNPRGFLQARAMESSTPVPQSGRPLRPTVPHGLRLRQQGVTLDPQWPSHDGFEVAEPCRRERVGAFTRSWPSTTSRRCSCSGNPETSASSADLPAPAATDVESVTPGKRP